MREEGSIKFHSHWIRDVAPTAEALKALNHWRNILYGYGLIGVNADGIGYGNLSVRSDDHSFLITGSSTGHIRELTADHFTRVTSYSFDGNSLTSTGPIQASSESLTHAMVYECAPEANAVFHVHHLAFWNSLLNRLPATSPEVAYGTPDMAREVARLFRESPLSANRIFAMGGHEEGIIAFGKDVDEAGQLLLSQLLQQANRLTFAVKK